jgi:hypothetical protein
MDERRWREAVIEQVNKVHVELTENTATTREGVKAVNDLSSKVEELSQKVRPITDFSDKVTKGFQVVGWIGGAAEWVVKKWIPIALVAVAVKILWSGGTWAEVARLWAEK